MCFKMSSIFSEFFLNVLLVFSSTLAQTSNKPCENNPEYAKLDFWVGEWEVIAGNGVKAGDNSIRKILDSCAIIEDWTGTDGSKGMSLSYYDPKLKTWKQVWLTQNAVATGPKRRDRPKEGTGPKRRDRWNKRKNVD